MNLKTESYLSALQRLAKPSHFDSVSQTHCFKELHNAFLKPIWVPKTLTFWASVSLKTTMSASKAKSTRKHQRSESEFAVSDKRNRVEDDFDLDLSKLVTSNTILLLLLFLCLKIFFVRFFYWDLRLKKKMVESQWYQRHCVGAASDPREGSEGRPEEERRDYFQVIRIVLLTLIRFLMYNLEEAVISVCAFVCVYIYIF